MAFKVKLFTGAPDFEALHVAKLTCFPLEQRDYKPYSQARVCFAGDGMHVQLLSFEAQPLPDSEMRALFYLSGTDICRQAPLTLSVHANGQSGVCLGGEQSRTPITDGVLCHRFTGEDLQGVFWGGNIFVSNEVLGEYCNAFLPVPGMTFKGNLYKLCENPQRPHYGCYYPADFSKWLGAEENLGDFTIIDY